MHKVGARTAHSRRRQVRHELLRPTADDGVEVAEEHHGGFDVGGHLQQGSKGLDGINRGRPVRGMDQGRGKVTLDADDKPPDMLRDESTSCCRGHF